jgi:hypothetical protein
MSVNLKEFPHSIVGDIRGRPVSADYDVQTRVLTA